MAHLLKTVNPEAVEEIELAEQQRANALLEAIPPIRTPVALAANSGDMTVIFK